MHKSTTQPGKSPDVTTEKKRRLARRKLIKTARKLSRDRNIPTEKRAFCERVLDELMKEFEDKKTGTEEKGGQ